MQLYHTPPPWPLFTRARTRARAHTHAKCGGRGEDEKIHVHKGCVFVCVCARARRCVNSMSAWISWMSELHRWEEGWLNTCRPWLYTTQCRCHSHLPPTTATRRLAELTPTVQSPLHSPHTQTYASLYSPHTSTCCTQLLWRLCVFQPRVGPHLLVTWRLCTRADTHGQEGERDEKHGRREYKKKRQRTGNGPEKEANGRASGLGHRHRYSAPLMSTGCRRRGV